MSQRNEMLDVDVGTCHMRNIAQHSQPDDGQSECHCNSQNQEEFSKMGWGGPRANSGGARTGAGRPRKSSEPEPSADPRWCVISFFGQAETSATTELARAGYDAYMPLTAIRRRDPVITSMWHTVRVPLWPGYGFIRLAPMESREPILAVRGVREVLLLPSGRPAWVRDKLIDDLRDGDEARLKLPKEHGPVLKVGTIVRIEDGPFASFPGKVIECDGVKTRVEVEFFGRPTPMWLDRVAVAET